MWLVLIGPSGTGKTHLAAGIANEKQDKAGVGVIMVTNTELLDYLRSGVDGRVQLKLERRLSILRNVSVLVLDDLNFGSMSAWAREKVFQVLDYRYLRRMKTIITRIRSIEGNGRPRAHAHSRPPPFGCLCPHGTPVCRPDAQNLLTYGHFDHWNPSPFHLQPPRPPHRL
ncbi:MAG: ATP-binding protein [Chloroflexi bacterium]|uniref:ATP-binding protein n=1 Tax=Candidatus Flexifilum breve TaxID=3140694 RepID=UPI0031365BB9|nr:ATP-binding protein [Chloroflexota bacterium]